MDGKKLHGGNPASAIAAGIGFCTEDRKKEGLALRLSILLNMTLVRLLSAEQAGRHPAEGPAGCGGQYMKSISIKAPRSISWWAICPAATSRRWLWPKWLMMNPKSADCG